MIRPLAAALAVALAATLIPAAALAQSPPAPAQSVPGLAQSTPAPAPAASSSPVPSVAPNAIGPALGPNDPCTSLAAIVTRPSVTNSVCTVRSNHVLIETGYQNTSIDGGGNGVAYPQTLIRVGTALPALELDLAPPSTVRTNAGGAVTSGSTDVGAGLKYVFGYTPKFSYGGQVFFTAPTGTSGFSAGGTQTTYALQAGYTLGPVFSLAGTLQDASLLAGGTQRYASIISSLVLTAALPNATGVFAEAAQFTKAAGPGTPTRTQYLGGAYHDFGQRFQLDLESGFSPTTATGKYRYVGVGASYYF